MDKATFEAACTAYRTRHGAQSLFPYHGRGRSFICKHVDESEAVLVQLRTHEELRVTTEQFGAEFTMYFADEAVFLVGSEAEQAAMHAELSAQIEACRLCVESESSDAACLDNQGQPEMDLMEILLSRSRAGEPICIKAPLGEEQGRQHIKAINRLVELSGHPVHVIYT